MHSLKEREWFIYCGHGSGGLLVDRDEVASLTSCSAGDVPLTLPFYDLFFFSIKKKLHTAM